MKRYAELFGDQGPLPGDVIIYPNRSIGFVYHVFDDEKVIGVKRFCRYELRTWPDSSEQTIENRACRHDEFTSAMLIRNGELMR